MIAEEITKDVEELIGKFQSSVSKPEDNSEQPELIDCETILIRFANNPLTEENVRVSAAKALLSARTKREYFDHCKELLLLRMDEALRRRLSGMTEEERQKEELRGTEWEHLLD